MNLEEVRRLLDAAKGVPIGPGGMAYDANAARRLEALAPELASEVLRLTAERDEARLYAELRDSGESVEPPPWWEIRQEGA